MASSEPTNLFSFLSYAIRNPLDARTLAQNWVFGETKRDITSPDDFASTGYDRDTMKKCWAFLDTIAGPFAVVVKELEGDLARVTCLLVLVVRGLAIIEEDATIAPRERESLLKGFYQKLTESGWKFEKSGPNVSDKALLAEFDAVIAEIARLEASVKTIIIDTAKQMGHGRAEFVHRAANAVRVSDALTAQPIVVTKKEYDLYSHYTTGLAVEAFSNLTVAVPCPERKPDPFSNAPGRPAMPHIERPLLGEQKLLSSSLGLLLRKTEIIRRVHEDSLAGRPYWPEQVVRRAGTVSLEELVAAGIQGNEGALWALSEMVLSALGHAVDMLDYLVLLRNQSVFNAVALPSVMAITLLDTCFMNKGTFVGGVSIGRAATLRLQSTCTDPHTVAYKLLACSRSIRRRISRADPNFLALSVMCGKIETWVEHHFPSFITFTKESRTIIYDDADPRSKIVKRDQEMDRQRERLERERTRDADIRAWMEKHGVTAPGAINDKMFQADGSPVVLYIFLIAGILFLFVGGAALIVGILWYFYGDEWSWEEQEEGQGIGAVFSKLFSTSSGIQKPF